MRHIKYEGINGLYKKVLPIKKKSMNSHLERWAKDMNGYFIDKDKEPHMAKKCIRNIQHHL